MSQTKSSSRLSLEQKIAKARLKLQEAYDTCGCTDSKVLATSIKLDRLLNRYQQKLLEETVPGFKERGAGVETQNLIK